MLWFTKHAKVVGVTRAPSTSQNGGGARREHAGNLRNGRGVGAVVVDVGPDQHQALRHAERKAQTYGKALVGLEKIKHTNTLTPVLYCNTLVL